MKDSAHEVAPGLGAKSTVNDELTEELHKLAKKANYATNRTCYPGVDISDSATKKEFIALETEVDKLNIAKLINIPSSLNNLTIEVDNLSLDEWKLQTTYYKLEKIKWCSR